MTMPDFRSKLILLRAVGVACGWSPAAAWGFEWEAATPASQGMDVAALAALQDDLEARRTKALLVIRHDKIVWEWYADGHGPDQKHHTASMAKALVGGVATAVAMTDGLISLDEKAADYVLQWRSHPRKSQITVRHLGSHTSGLADSSVPGIEHPDEPGWKGEFWRWRNQQTAGRDAFTLSRDAAEVLFEPGEAYQYSNPGIAMLSYVLTAALKDAPRKDLRTLLRDRVMRPIDAADDSWSVGYGHTQEVDGLPLVAPWGGGAYTARTTARVGRLMMRGGDWDGQRLISAEAVQAVTRDAGTPDYAGIGFWSNAEGLFEDLPRDAFWGSGAGHQVMLVVPSLKLIAVRNGATLDESMDHRQALLEHVLAPLVAAIQTQPPYPPSPVIAGIDWVPASTIVRDAHGADNWPMTWSDDDRQYLVTIVRDVCAVDSPPTKSAMSPARDGRRPDGKDLKNFMFNRDFEPLGIRPIACGSCARSSAWSGSVREWRTT